MEFCYDMILKSYQGMEIGHLTYSRILDLGKLLRHFSLSIHDRRIERRKNSKNRKLTA